MWQFEITKRRNIYSPEKELPAHGQEIHHWNGYFARHYQLIDEESTGGLIIVLRITSSWTRNPPKITKSLALI
jgi:hypothetical protein